MLFSVAQSRPYHWPYSAAIKLSIHPFIPFSLLPNAKGMNVWVFRWQVSCLPVASSSFSFQEDFPWPSTIFISSSAAAVCPFLSFCSFTPIGGFPILPFFFHPFRVPSSIPTLPSQIFGHPFVSSVLLPILGKIKKGTALSHPPNVLEIGMWCGAFGTTIGLRREDCGAQTDKAARRALNYCGVKAMMSETTVDNIDTSSFSFTNSVAAGCPLFPPKRQQEPHFSPTHIQRALALD